MKKLLLLASFGLVMHSGVNAMLKDILHTKPKNCNAALEQCREKNPNSVQCFDDYNKCNDGCLDQHKKCNDNPKKMKHSCAGELSECTGIPVEDALKLKKSERGYDASQAAAQEFNYKVICPLVNDPNFTAKAFLNDRDPQGEVTLFTGQKHGKAVEEKAKEFAASKKCLVWISRKKVNDADISMHALEAKEKKEEVKLPGRVIKVPGKVTAQSTPALSAKDMHSPEEQVRIKEEAKAKFDKQEEERDQSSQEKPGTQRIITHYVVCPKKLSPDLREVIKTQTLPAFSQAHAEGIANFEPCVLVIYSTLDKTTHVGHIFEVTGQGTTFDNTSKRELPRKLIHKETGNFYDKNIEQQLAAKNKGAAQPVASSAQAGGSSAQTHTAATDSLQNQTPQPFVMQQACSTAFDKCKKDTPMSETCAKDRAACFDACIKQQEECMAENRKSGRISSTMCETKFTQCAGSGQAEAKRLSSLLK